MGPERRRHPDWWIDGFGVHHPPDDRPTDETNETNETDDTDGIDVTDDIDVARTRQLDDRPETEQTAAPSRPRR